MSAGLNGSMNVVRDGQAWRVGRPAEVSWIADGTKNGQGIAAAIPPIFATYATLWDSNEDRVTTRTHEHAVVGHLIEHTAADQTWWLGFLDTGAHDIVFTDAPRVTLYSGWSYVLIEAGPTQAVMWRTGHMRSSEGALPDLMFPADRAWLVSALWDDTWTCVGGSLRLIEALERDPLVHARTVWPGENPKPYDLPFTD